MAEEFEQLPIALQRISSKLVHHRKSRTAFICGVIIIMSLASSISLLLSPQTQDSTRNNTDSIVKIYFEPNPKYNMNLLEYSRSLTLNKLLKKIDLVYLTATVYQNLTVNAGLDTTNFSVTNKINIHAG